MKLDRTMVRPRVLDERGLALQRQGRIGFYLQCIGQEASHIGSTYALRDSDWVFPSYRQLGSMLLRGARLDNLLCEWKPLRRAMPVAGGGITVDRLPELFDFYGNDVMFLIGGNLYQAGDQLLERARSFVRGVEGLG